MVVGKRCGTCIGSLSHNPWSSAPLRLSNTFSAPDRKIRCDRGFPACANCTRTNRTCQGYGVRLSWPRDHDRKRFVVGPVPAGKQHIRWRRSDHAVHVTTRDMELYRHLTETRGAGKSVKPLPLFKTLPPVPSTMTTSEKELLYFCVLHLFVFNTYAFCPLLTMVLLAVKSSVSASLTTFAGKPVGDLIMRIALSGSTPSVVAVQRAMLALSYVFHYGAGIQAEQLKISALRALITSSGMSLSSKNAVQHVAAGMLLCVFEVTGLA